MFEEHRAEGGEANDELVLVKAARRPAKSAASHAMSVLWHGASPEMRPEGRNLRTPSRELLSTGMISLLMPLAASRPDALDERAFAAAAAELGPHVRAVVAALMRLGQDHPDVEDCTHEALRRALDCRDRLREGEPLKPWLTGIARHVALDALRARRRQRERTVTSPASREDGPGPLEAIRDGGPSPFDRLATAQTRDRVARALDALPEGQRRALAMFHLEGLSYQEIAARLGVPLGTVATWVMRARKSVAAAVQIAEES